MVVNAFGESSPSRRTLAGERRVVTILFSDVKGSTAMAENLDPEDWAEIMNEAFEYLTKPIIQYGGTVARLMGDAVLAFFGAPAAHEDDPLRAVLAGLDMVNGIQSFREKISSEYDLDFNLRVGINTGVVVVGEIGTALAGEYTAMGDAVNLAARMEQTAKPGTIQITEETYRLVSPWIEVESLGLLEAKGKSNLVPVYCVLGRRMQPTRARGIAGLGSPLVGRSIEYEQLATVMNELLHGRGRIVTLIGEAGLGKSRMIEELQIGFKEQTSAEFQWVEARGISYEISRPYGLFVQTLRQFCNVNEEDSAEIIREKVEDSFKSLNHDQRMGITNTIELLLTVDNVSDDIDQSTKGEAVKREIFESMVNIWTVKANEKPLITIFDDLHWADPASIELLKYLFQLVSKMPILILCAFRPYHDSSAWQLKNITAKQYPNDFLEVNLTLLDDQESGQLVENLLSNSDFPVGLRRMIFDKSEGNPFYLEEVVRTLIDRKLIQRDAELDLWRLSGSYEDIDIPDNLQALLLARIDRLDQETRHTLQLASVVGRVFKFHVLQSMAEPVEDLDERLGILQQMDLINETAPLPDLEYTFRHELTREAAYKSILRRQRREYHRKVGAALESIYSDKLAEEAHLLAYHYNAARDYQQALKYYRIAGDQSLKLFANQEASDYYQQAIKIALKLNLPNVQLAKLFTLNGRALELHNRFDQALDNYEELEDLGRLRNDRSLELAALVPQATIYSTPNVKFDPKLGAEISRRALNLAIDLRDYEAEAKTLWSLMLIQSFSAGDLDQGIAYGEQGLRIARQHHLHEVAAYIQHDLARPYMRVGRLNDAWGAYRSSQNYWRESDNLPMLADNLASLSESYYTAGDFERSMEYANEGLQISQEIGNIWGQAYNHFVIGPILLERGEIDDCLEALETTLNLSRDANFAAGIVVTQMIKSWIYTQFGDVVRAENIQHEILSFVEKYESFRPLYQVNLAQNKLFSGAQEEALQIFEDIGLKWTDSELIFHPYIYTLHVEIYLARKTYNLALQTAGKYLQYLNQSQIKVLLPDLINQKARALIGLGQIEKAYQELQAALSLAREQNSRRILWAILLDLANLEKDENKARKMRKEAQQTIEFIGDHISDPILLDYFHKLPRVQGNI